MTGYSPNGPGCTARAETQCAKEEKPVVTNSISTVQQSAHCTSAVAPAQTHAS
jgi:hypothetical protein